MNSLNQKNNLSDIILDLKAMAENHSASLNKEEKIIIEEAIQNLSKLAFRPGSPLAWRKNRKYALGIIARLINKLFLSP